jgi:prepilin-type N-terminal cleavage/methylation domain-containing protein
MKYRLNRIYKKIISKNGFSLVELLIVILIIMIIASVASILYLNSIRSQEDILGKAQSQKDGRTALYLIEKEVREAVSVSSAGNNNITFLSNADQDDEYEQISYFTELSGDNYILIREEDESGSKVFLTSLVSDDIFSYYSQIESDTIELPMDISTLNTFKILKISFILNDKPEYPDKNLVISSSVYLRNR